MTTGNSGTSRRGLIAAAASGLIAGAALPARAAPATTALSELKKEADVACVYHCDYGDPQRFLQTLTNIGNHYSAYGGDPFAIQISLVAHGPGVKFFLDSVEGTSWRGETMPPDVFERIEDTARNGLRIHLCEITFSRLKLDKSRARKADFISFVPSGVAAVGTLQAKGFGYMKIG